MRDTASHAASPRHLASHPAIEEHAPRGFLAPPLVLQGRRACAANTKQCAPFPAFDSRRLEEFHVDVRAPRQSARPRGSKHAAPTMVPLRRRGSAEDVRGKTSVVSPATGAPFPSDDFDTTLAASCSAAKSAVSDGGTVRTE